MDLKVIYHCYGGSHSSVLAAALHLRLLPRHRLPTLEEMMALPYFDKTTDEDFGAVKFMGVDEYNNEVYCLGKKSLGDRYSNLLTGIAGILGKEGEVLAVNTMNRVNWFMKLGGYASRRAGLVALGRPVLGRGTRQAFFELLNLVEITHLKSMQSTQQKGKI